MSDWKGAALEPLNPKDWKMRDSEAERVGSYEDWKGCRAWEKRRFNDRMKFGRWEVLKSRGG